MVEGAVVLNAASLPGAVSGRPQQVGSEEATNEASDELAMEAAVATALAEADENFDLTPNADELPLAAGGESSVAISTSTTSARVAINLNIDEGRVTADEIPSGAGVHNVWARSVSLVASAPLVEDSERSQLYSLSGPEDGFTLGLTANFHQYRFRRASNADIADDQASASRLFELLKTPAIEACTNTEDEDGNRRTEANCRALRVQDGARLFIQFLDPDELTGDDRLTSVQQAAYDALTGIAPPITLDSGPLLNFGLNGSISYDEFTYFDPATAMLQEDQERIGFQAGVSGSLIFPDDRFSLTASAAFQRNYEASSNRAVCPLEAEDDETFIDCPLRRFGEPSRDDSLLLRGEWRYRIGRSVAISPHVVFDALDDEVRLELPIYFIPDDDSNLTGGIRVGYDSEEDDEVILGVFVSTPFEF